MSELTSQRRFRIPGGENTVIFLYFALTIIFLISAWEGFKFLGKTTDYELELGSTNINLDITRDNSMPHLVSIVAELFDPVRADSPLLIEILFDAAKFTFKYAFFGFIIGTVFGLVLAIIFVHSKFLSRGLMPYVVASQTVPVLALAPMVIIWADQLFHSREQGVAVIAAFLAFYPVTIYALRGLSDVPTTSLELMQSYAASNWEILWKLRFPNAMPYIFTALKITAPASVVGAIIGELPSGIQDGLGGQIINYAQYFATQPKRLWATNLVTAILGIGFFLSIVIIERFVVRWKYSESTFNRVVEGIFRFFISNVKRMVNVNRG
jgi:NitT/TauT family transport system permease protein